MTQPDARRRVLIHGFFFVCFLAAACADKTLSPRQPGGDAHLTLQTRFAAQNAPTARIVDVDVSYARTSGERIVIGSNEIPVAEGSQQIGVSVDLAACLADELHDGSRDMCRIHVAIALRDTGSIALDSLELGPLDLAGGSVPAIAPVDLAVQRYAVRQWVTESPLNLGNSHTPLGYAGLTGVVAGTGAPTLFSVANDATGERVAIFENGQWRSISTNTGAALLFDIALLRANDGWIATSQGLFHFNGNGTSAIPQVTDSLRSVAAFESGSERLIVAVGGAVGGGAVIWRGNGSTWTRDNVTIPETLTAVCVTALDEAFALGTTSTTVWRWDGISWSATAGPAGTKGQPRCAGRGEAFALNLVGAASTPLRWDGTAFVPMPAQQIADWAVVSPSEIYAWSSGSPELSRRWFRFNGSTWQAIGASTFGQINNFGWADPRGGRAYGTSSFGRLEMFDAATSQISVLSYLPDVRDLLMTSPTHAVAVGWNLFVAQWNGSNWSVITPPSGTASVRILQGVWSTGPSNIWTVSSVSTILHWNGSAWTIISDQLNQLFPVHAYVAIWGTGNTVFIGGSRGIAGVAMVRCTAPSRSSCVDESPPGTGQVQSIWGTSASNVWAVGTSGQIWHRDGSTWSVVTSPTTQNLFRVWGSSASDVWAVGTNTLLHFDGTAWTEVPRTGVLAQLVLTNSGDFQLGLWGSGPRDVYLGTANGKIARFDGQSWTLMPTGPSTGRIAAITGIAGVGAFALQRANNSANVSQLLRGIGPTGGLAAPSIAPTIWP